MNSQTARRVLVGSTLFGGVFELVSTPFMDQPAGSLLAGIVFLAAAAWLWRGRGIVAPVVLGLLFAVELAGEPAYSRHGAKDWILQSAIGAVSLVGLVAAIVVVRERVRGRRRNAAIA